MMRHLKILFHALILFIVFWAFIVFVFTFGG